MKQISVLFLSAFCSLIVLAQDAKPDVDVNTKSSSFNVPWVWIVGGVVFVLLLVALLSGRRKA